MRKILKKKSKNLEKVSEDTEENGNNANEAITDEESEEQYEVQKIVDSKVENNLLYFLIRWKGYTSEDDTWEAEDKIEAPEAIAAFKKRNDKTEKKIVTSKKETTNSKTKKRTASSAPSTAHKKVQKKNNGKSDKEKEWDVERIVDMVDEKGEKLFRIRWKGYSASSDTWEPESNLSCEALIQKYLRDEKRHANQDVDRKDLRDNRKTTERYVPHSAGRSSRRYGKVRKIYCE